MWDEIYTVISCYVIYIYIQYYGYVETECNIILCDTYIYIQYETYNVI